MMNPREVFQKATGGAIAAGNKLTASAGLEMLKLGGNAFDAAVAAAFTSSIVEPTLTSLGGSGFLLAHTSDRHNILFDFFSQTPLQKKHRNLLDFYDVEINFGDAKQTFHIGFGSIATPSNLAGLFHVHQQLGKLHFQAVIEPAIHYAKNGFTLNSFQAYCHSLLKPILTKTREGKNIYAPQGKLLSPGDICKMPPALASILAEVGKKGINFFYKGDLARQISTDLKSGGYLTIDDFNHYSVQQRQPLQIDYRGYKILTNPLPSSGGILIAFALKMLESFDFQGIEFGSKQHLEILARVMQITNLARQGVYNNSRNGGGIEAYFLNGANLDYYRSKLLADKLPTVNQVSQDNSIGSINKWGSTNHISVIDSKGNAASITTSNGEGSSYIVPNTGIMLNNMLGEADLNPLGFHQWECNKRISSMMSPTIVLKDGKPEIVLGSGGSNRIRTAILQVISNLIDFRQPLNDAVQNPRVHWEGNQFDLEPSSNTEININTISALRLPELTQTTLWKDKNMFFGGVNAVVNAGNGLFEGVGDLRRDGVAFSH